MWGSQWRTVGSEKIESQTPGVLSTRERSLDLLRSRLNKEDQQQVPSPFWKLEGTFDQ